MMVRSEVAKACARCFKTPSGKRVLSYLEGITRARVLGSGATDAELRFLEGQRALVAHLARLIEEGKQGATLSTDKGEING